MRVIYECSCGVDLVLPTNQFRLVGKADTFSYKFYIYHSYPLKFYGDEIYAKIKIRPPKMKCTL